MVVGGTGFFGRAAADLLRGFGLAPVIAARRAELRVDVEDPASIRAALRASDVVVDAAGPFQQRSAALAAAAIEIGFDLVDLADALGYVERIIALDGRAREAGVRLLPACSTASAVSSALIAWSGIDRPVRFQALLVPATRHTAVPATAASLLASVGRPVRVLRGGGLVEAAGFGSAFSLPTGDTMGVRRGRLFEVADAVTLPTAYPSLRQVEWFVDPNVRGLAVVLRLAARMRPLRSVLDRTTRAALPLARLLGREHGGFGAEIEDDAGTRVRVAITARRDAHRLAVLPAALAARALLRGEFEPTGVIPPHRQVPADVLRAEAERLGFAIEVGR